MTSEQINIAIAESLGWTQVQLYVSDPAKRLWGYTPGPDTDWTSVPNYTADLNAMHEVEIAVVPSKWIDYEYYLGLAIEKIHGEAYLKYYISATALQRAEAYLRTIGKWNET